MTKIHELKKALSLRKKGKSYSQIKEELRISKSTLSRWLGKIPLTKIQLRNLKDKNQNRIEKFILTMRLKREKRLNQYYQNEKLKILPLSIKELYLSGIFLYWGEGNKTSRSSISVSNTDPEVLKFTIFWMIKSLSIKKEKIKIYLHLYSDMNIKEEINYWSHQLNINSRHFSKPYIKKTKKISLDQKGFGHGTCTVVFNNTQLKETLLMSIKAISDFFGGKIRSI